MFELQKNTEQEITAVHNLWCMQWGLNINIAVIPTWFIQYLWQNPSIKTDVLLLKCMFIFSFKTIALQSRNAKKLTEL